MTARAASFASSFIQLIWFLCTAHKIKGTLSHHSIIQSQLRLCWEAHSRFSCNSMCGRAILEELDHVWMCCRYRVTLPVSLLLKLVNHYFIFMWTFQRNLQLLPSTSVNHLWILSRASWLQWFQLFQRFKQLWSPGTSFLAQTLHGLHSNAWKQF